MASVEFRVVPVQYKIKNETDFTVKLFQFFVLLFFSSFAF
jgi:hypothetical protein